MSKIGQKTQATVYSCSLTFKALSDVISKFLLPIIGKVFLCSVVVGVVVEVTVVDCVVEVVVVVVGVVVVVSGGGVGHW